MIHVLVMYDMPGLVSYVQAFIMIKTYGIVSLSCPGLRRRTLTFLMWKAFDSEDCWKYGGGHGQSVGFEAVC